MRRSKPCYVGIHWKALAECSQLSTHVLGFLMIFQGFASFCIGQISHQQRTRVLKGMPRSRTSHPSSNLHNRQGASVVSSGREETGNCWSLRWSSSCVWWCGLWATRWVVTGVVFLVDSLYWLLALELIWTNSLIMIDLLVLTWCLTQILKTDRK